MDIAFRVSFRHLVLSEESDSTESELPNQWTFAKDRPPSPEPLHEAPPYNPAKSPLWQKFLSYRRPSHERVSQISKPTLETKIMGPRKRKKFPVVHLILKNQKEFRCPFNGCKSEYARKRDLQSHMFKHLSAEKRKF